MQLPNLADVPDPILVDEGEYELQIKAADPQVSENTGRHAIRLRLENLDEPDAEAIFHSIWLPKDEDDDSKRKKMLQGMKRQVEALGLDLANYTLEDFVGITVRAHVIQTEFDGQYRNEIKKFL